MVAIHTYVNILKFCGKKSSSYSYTAELDFSLLLILSARIAFKSPYFYLLPNE